MYWNKRRGKPASDDILALSSVLLRLKTDTNAWLRARGEEEMQVAFITVPLLPALYTEDLINAAHFVGLQ